MCPITGNPTVLPGRLDRLEAQRLLTKCHDVFSIDGEEDQGEDTETATDQLEEQSFKPCGGTVVAEVQGSQEVADGLWRVGQQGKDEEGTDIAQAETEETGEGLEVEGVGGFAYFRLCCCYRRSVSGKYAPYTQWVSFKN